MQKHAKRQRNDNFKYAFTSERPPKDKKLTKNCYLEDDFYNKAKHFLKEKTEKQLRLAFARPARNKDRSKPKQLTKWKFQTKRCKKFLLQSDYHCNACQSLT